MKEQKIDRRVRKTKSALLKCLTKLMSQKKLNDITVKELTELADVNRSTFYLYYKDIFDMVEQIETEMFDEFIKIFQSLNKENDRYANFLSFYTYIFEYVQSNAEICKILLGHDGDYAFIQKFKDAIMQTKPPFNGAISEIKIHFLRPFIISGFIGVVQQWLEDGLNVPPKDMAIIMTEINSTAIHP
ncbi:MULTISPECIES: TetR/AcrR family transcriptional regulator [Clostridium]|uniref:TetR/AcrR family transcriptional regulator n=1 Tax=Clostridium TaxID=1485 RepID=UPI000825E033|nr:MULTISPECIES: TetR/AcrR family transcriptional regulator [Clostridium]PJI07167.1 TetR/AcrR family transcriptional regulator [Clostridium sp. CT7]